MIPTKSPIGTPVWVQVSTNFSVAGKTAGEPYHSYFAREILVKVQIGDDEHDYPLTRVQRRRAKR